MVRLPPRIPRACQSWSQLPGVGLPRVRCIKLTPKWGVHIPFWLKFDFACGWAVGASNLEAAVDMSESDRLWEWGCATELFVMLATGCGATLWVFTGRLT